MNETGIREAVLRAIREVAPEVDPSAIAGDEPLRAQVDIDSVDFLRVLLGVRRALGIDVPESDYARIATLDDFVAYLAARPGGAVAAPPA